VPIPAAEPEELKGLELSVLYPWVNESETAFLSLIADFNANNTWGIKLQPHTAGSLSAVAEALAAGDLMKTSSSGTGTTLRQQPKAAR